VDRWACVDVAALPLQLLLRRQPRWARRPAAVVDRDHPQGVILWVNAAARRRCVRAGLRYAQALSLAADLRAAVVPQAQIAAAIARLAARLRRFSPAVEPCAAEPGVFWLDASGLDKVAPSLAAWARSIAGDLRTAGLAATVVVGFERFATYALARAGAGVRVLESPAVERALAGRVPLDALALEPRVRDALAQLGIDDVAGLRALPGGGVRERFGAAGSLLQRLAAGTYRPPLAPAEERAAPCARVEPDPELHGFDRSALLFLLKRRLGGLCAELARRGEAVAALHLRLQFDGGEKREERIAPAAPTLDEAQLLDLLRLRLEALTLRAPPVGFEVVAEGARAPHAQLELFAAKMRRDLRAADRALASVRAELGDDAVVRAVLRDGHLPLARFTWEPLARLAEPQPDPAAELQLVRRLRAQPERFVATAGAIESWCGPYRIAGGWWQREVQRDEFFAHQRDGGVLWVFRDRIGDRWYRQGGVE
jgi:protein ImuB